MKNPKQQIKKAKTMIKKLASIEGVKESHFGTTAEFFEKKLGDVTVVHKISEPERKPNIADLLHEKKIDFIINVPSTSTLEKYVGMLYDEYQIRRKSLELGIPVLSTIELAESFVKTLEWLQKNEPSTKPLESYKDIS